MGVMIVTEGSIWKYAASQPFYTVVDPDCSSLSGAITAIGSDDATLIIPPGTHVAGGVTVPTNVEIIAMKGATLSIADGTVFTCNGPFSAGPYLVFDDNNLTYDGVVFGSGAVNILRSAWFETGDTQALTVFNAGGIAIWIKADNTVTYSSLTAETTSTMGALINGATAKTTPVDADMVGLMNSASTPANILYKLSWANIKATLKTYFDAIYIWSKLTGKPEYTVGDTGGYGNFAEAVATLNAAGTACNLIVPSGTHSVTDNLTVNSNIHLIARRGAIITIATAKTLTINGSLDAGLYQIFSCTGTGKVVWNNPQKPNVAWWGPTADGVTDDSAAFQAAIVAVSEGNYRQNVSVAPGSYALSSTVLFYRGCGLDCGSNYSVNFVVTGTTSAFGNAEALWTSGDQVHELLTEVTIDASANVNSLWLVKFDYVSNRQAIKRCKFYGNNTYVQNGIWFNATGSNNNQIVDNVFRGFQNGKAVKLGDLATAKIANLNYIMRNEFSGTGFTNAVEWYGEGNLISGNNLGSSYQPIAFNSTYGYAEGGLNVPFVAEATSYQNEISGNYCDNGRTHVLAKTTFGSGSSYSRLTAINNVGMDYSTQIMDLTTGLSDACALTAANQVTITGANRTNRYRPGDLAWFWCGSVDPVADGWWSAKVLTSTLSGSDTVITLDTDPATTLPGTVTTIYQHGHNNNPQYDRVVFLSVREQRLVNAKIGTLQLGKNSAVIKVLSAGSLTCANAADTVVTDTAATVNSKIFLFPTNAAAATLQAGANCLRVKTKSIGGFTVTTAGGGAAAGTETFDYFIVDVG